MPAVGSGPDATDEQPALETHPTEEQPALQRPPDNSTDELPAPKGLAAQRGARPPVRDRSRPIPVGRGAPPKKRSVLVPVLLLGVLGVGGAVAYQKFLAAPPPPPAVKNPGLADASVAFQEGKNLVRKGQWKLAAEQFNAAAELAPNLEGLAGYLAAQKVEIPNQEHLDAAQAALDKNEVGRAAKELSLVPETTQQLTRRQALQTRLGKVADERVKEGRALLGNRARMKELKALAEDVLAARPNDRDGLTFLETANRALGWKAPVAAPADPGDPANEVISLWAGGDTTAAFSKADACSAASPRCAKLKEQSVRATDLLKKLESLEENELLELVRLDKALAGGAQSASGKQAGIRLAAVLTPRASSAAARKQWGAAMAFARKILEGDPGNVTAKNIVSDARSAAQELFHRCYVSRQATPEDAIPLCKEVVEMLPEGDPLREKAERLIKGGATE